MSSPDGVAQQVPALRRDIRVLAWVLASGVSSLGDVAWYIGLAWTAAHIGGASGAALVMGIGTLPRAAVLLFGGALADRIDARRTMVVANLARIGILLGGIGIMTADNTRLWMLATVALAFGLVDGLYLPASSVIPRQMVRPEDLGRVAALFALVSRLATLAGAPIGGVLTAHGGITLVMAFDAVSFAVIAVILALFVRPRFARKLAIDRSNLAILRSGFAYVRGHADVRILVIALSGLNLFVSPVTNVGLPLRTTQESWTATSLGLFSGCVGAGAAAGALLALRWRPHHPARTGLLLLVPQAIACMSVGVAGYFWIIAAMIVIGLTAGLASALLSGAFQATVDTEYLGRTSSIMSLADSAFMPLAMAGFGALAAVASVSLACAIAGVGFAVLVIWSATRLSPTARSHSLNRCRS